MQTSPQLTCHDHKCMVLSSLKLEKYWAFSHVPPLRAGLAVEHAFSSSYLPKTEALLICFLWGVSAMTCLHMAEGGLLRL